MLTVSDGLLLRQSIFGSLCVSASILTRLFETFRTRRNWQNTVVVVLSDRGQLLGERGSIGHSISLDEEFPRIPLIIKGTRAQPLRGVYRDQFQVPGIFPLILELAGVPTKDTQMLTRVRAEKPVRTLAFAQLRHMVDAGVVKRPRWRSAEQWAVRTDTVKVVRDLEGRVTTVSVRNPEAPIASGALTQRLLGEIDRFLAGLPTSRSGPMLELRGDVLERLRSLGYIR